MCIATLLQGGSAVARPRMQDRSNTRFIGDTLEEGVCCDRGHPVGVTEYYGTLVRFVLHVLERLFHLLISKSLYMDYCELCVPQDLHRKKMGKAFRLLIQCAISQCATRQFSRLRRDCNGFKTALKVPMQKRTEHCSIFLRGK